ncbi:hypothetical protein [Actinoplanes sp. RD1]|uniref:hypothetical protein n=1 Tax=Actinoplanes sp. RD1 TaxID=3064538 RepID=UPI002742706D|nr:hypothetical protein [Actinoplanes sp. RD1]
MSHTDDLALLRAYEPAIRYTDGEFFFPVSAERYVACASLWRDEPGGPSAEVVPARKLDLAALAGAGGAEHGLHHSLSAVARSSGPALIPLRERPPHLHGASRLASVGLTARFVDTFNRASLIVRGSVPGGSAARSFLMQRDHLAPERPTYHGRVLRDSPWIVLQYWFFYSFNNWRSAFGGVNEHEGDWEQVTVYLDGTGVHDEAGLPPARWVVYSAHDETGDDLRRRWDDPDLTLVGGRHPVVFAGAGSHSGAYLPGDYLITVRPQRLRNLVTVLRTPARWLAPWSEDPEQGLGIPYVDYARGNGRAIGPGQPEGWDAVVIGDDTAWVRDYRGLWGHDTRDRLGGERGPAGPRYERDGTVRRSWADPVGWAGLAKVAPNPATAEALIALRADRIATRLAELDTEIDTLADDLRVTAAGLAASAPEVRALAGREQHLLKLRMERTRLADEQLRMAEAPEQEHPHAHLLHRRVPLQQATGLRGRLISWWSVISTPLILWAIGAAFSPFNHTLSPADVAGIWLVLLLTVEGLIRGRFVAVALRLAGAAALVAFLILLWFTGRYVFTVGFFAAALLVLIVNLREALRR